MSKKNEITFCTSECLEHSIHVLKEIAKDYKWENEQEYIKAIYMLSTLGYVITTKEYKKDMEKFFIMLGKKIKENNHILNEAKYYANIT